MYFFYLTMTSTTRQLLDLPQEITLHICQYLPFSSYMALTSVCRKARRDLLVVDMIKTFSSDSGRNLSLCLGFPGYAKTLKGKWDIYIVRHLRRFDKSGRRISRGLKVTLGFFVDKMIQRISQLAGIFLDHSSVRTMNSSHIKGAVKTLLIRDEHLWSRVCQNISDTITRYYSSMAQLNFDETREYPFYVEKKRRETHAGLIFPVTRIENCMRDFIKSSRCISLSHVGQDSGVALTVVIEYFLVNIWNSCLNVAGKKTLGIEHLHRALDTHLYLKRLFRE